MSTALLLGTPTATSTDTATADQADQFSWEASATSAAPITPMMPLRLAIENSSARLVKASIGSTLNIQPTRTSASVLPA